MNDTILKVLAEKIEKLKEEIEKLEDQNSILEGRIGCVLNVVTDFANEREKMSIEESKLMDDFILAACDNEKEAKSFKEDLFWNDIQVLPNVQ